MWFRKKKPVDFEAKVAAFVDEQVDAMGAYLCPRCGEEHVALELAFRWPDVATVTGIAGPEEPDDEITIAGKTFVRGVLRVPIHDSKNVFQIGIWARRDGANSGRLANQVRVIAPLFDAAVTIVPGEPGMRPSFELVDHPLARAQQDGVTEAVAAEWRAREAHFAEIEPMAAPFEATLAEHGWELLGAADTDKPACTDSIEVGHLVKVYIRLVTVSNGGEPALINAGWWLTIDHAANGRLSGRLNSVPKIPTTISTGTRMWPRRDQIYQRELEPGR
jgi:hypothetical protein